MTKGICHDLAVKECGGLGFGIELSLVKVVREVEELLEQIRGLNADLDGGVA